MNYVANWERATLGLAITGTAAFLVLLGFVLFPVKGGIWALVLTLALSPWLLTVMIVVVHSSSTFAITDGKIVFLRFGSPRRTFDVTDLVRLEIARGVLPGRFIFRSGTEMLVSGIALGNDGRLQAVLDSYGVAVKDQT